MSQAGGRWARALAVGAGITCAFHPAIAGAAPEGSVPVPPVLHARSAAVLDMRDGRVLWSQDGRRRLPMASTTKLMTALVSLELEHSQTDVTMTVPPEVKQTYGEILYLRPGDQYTYLQLLEGMLLPSANDAAVAIAVDSGGSLSRFVALMNDTARADGLTDTHFANPDGLNDPDHYSSADDLARLGWVAMANPVIRSIVHLPSATIPWPDHGGTRLIGNINDLLAYFPGADGVKTGYTSEAMNVIVGSAQRDGQSTIAVVMGEPASTFWRDEERLLDFGLALAAARGPVPAVTPPAGGDATPSADAARGAKGEMRLGDGVTAADMSTGSGAAAPAHPSTSAGSVPAIPGVITATLIPAQAAVGTPPPSGAVAAEPMPTAAPPPSGASGARGIPRTRIEVALGGAAAVVLLGWLSLGRRRRRPARLGMLRTGRPRGRFRME